MLETPCELIVGEAVIEGALPVGQNSMEVQVRVSLMDAATAAFIEEAVNDVVQTSQQIQGITGAIAEIHEEIEAHSAVVQQKAEEVAALVPELGDIDTVLRFKGTWSPSGALYPDHTQHENNSVFEAIDSGVVGGVTFNKGDLIRMTDAGWVRYGSTSAPYPLTQTSTISYDSPQGAGAPGTVQGTHKLARSIEQRQETPLGYNSILHINSEGGVTLTGATGNLRIPLSIPEDCYHWGMLTCYLKLSRTGQPDQIINHAMHFYATPTQQYVELLDESGSVISLSGEEVAIEYLISGSLTYIYSGGQF